MIEAESLSHKKNLLADKVALRAMACLKPIIRLESPEVKTNRGPDDAGLRAAGFSYSNISRYLVVMEIRTQLDRRGRADRDSSRTRGSHATMPTDDLQSPSRSDRRSLRRLLSRQYLQLSLIPLFTFFLCILIGGRIAEHHVADLINRSIDHIGSSVRRQLEDMGRNSIQSRARQVAGQIESFLSQHGDQELSRLLKDEWFRQMAMQRVGSSGYTCLYEAGTGTMRVHPNPKLVDTDMRRLSERLPSWWSIFEASLEGVQVSGYYDWLEPNESMRRKFMATSPVAPRSDGLVLMVAATIDADEFAAPLTFIKDKQREVSAEYGHYISHQAKLIGISAMVIMGVTLAVVVLFSQHAARRFAEPIRRLSDDARRVAEGDWEARGAPQGDERDDEIGELAHSFDHMRAQLRNQFEYLKHNYKKLKATQGELKRSEAHYRSLFDNVPIGLYRTTPEGRTLDANLMLLKMFKCPDKESFLLQPAERLYLKASDRQWFQSMVESQAGEFCCEFLMRCFDGTLIWVEDQARSVRDAAGKVLHYEGSLKDITDRKLSEMALRDSEARFRTAFENASVGMALVGLDGLFIEVNSALAQMIGRTAPEIIGTPETDYTHPDDHDARQRFMQGLVEGRSASGQDERRYLHAGGSVVSTLIWASVQRDQEGRPQYVISLIQDITARKKADDELRLFQYCVNHAAIGILQIGDDGRILDVNRQVCRNLGYAKEDLLRMRVFDIDPDLSPEKWTRHIKKIFPAGSRTIETSQRRKDGTTFPVEITTYYLKKENTGFSFAFVTDITHRVRSDQEKAKLEGQLRQAQKMEAIGTLAGGIAHDFNNILSVIIGYSNLIELSAGLSAEDRGCLQQILTAGDRAKQLVKQILTFSRRGDQQRLFVNLKSVVRETFDFLKATLPRNVEVRQNIHADIGVILADPIQLQQVLMNLCTNAAHAMEHQESGVLEIGLAKAVLSAEEVCFEHDVEPGDYVKLTVTDSGPGIDARVRERMFEPYFTTKGPGKGTGLGLSVVHGIVSAHGGFIKVYSEAGNGTSFHVFMPVAEGEGKAATPGDATPQGGSETLLLVDDEKAIVEMAREMLQRLGYRVETRTSPLEAIEAFRANPGKYNAVITDMTMPQMNGLNLARKLLEMRPDLPILLCTGFSDLASEEKARAAGIREFIFKPLTMSDFARATRSLLEKPSGPPGPDANLPVPGSGRHRSDSNPGDLPRR
jgi:PAS domain S-box-containing protein